MGNSDSTINTYRMSNAQEVYNEIVDRFEIPINSSNILDMLKINGTCDESSSLPNSTKLQQLMMLRYLMTGPEQDPYPDDYESSAIPDSNQNPNSSVTPVLNLNYPYEQYSNLNNAHPPTKTQIIGTLTVDDNNEGDECEVCLEDSICKTRRAVFVPCRHAHYCGACIKKLCDQSNIIMCPKCRTPVTTILVTFS